MLPDNLAKKAAQKNIPVSASIELTWRCNLRCVHCYQYPACDGELSTAEVKAVLDQLRNAGCLYLAFTGGEPLTRPDFRELAEYAVESSFAVILQTNGLLITPDLARTIREMRFLSVHISILGAGAATHDAIVRQKGAFERVIGVIRILRKLGVNVVLKVTVMQQNFAEAEAMRRLAGELTSDIVFSPVIYPRSDGDPAPTRYRLTDDQLRQLYSFLARLDPEQFEHQTRDNVSPLCQFGRTDCCISATGKVYPCAAVPLVVGDLRRNTFAEIWEEAEELHRIRGTTLADMKECSACALAADCIRCSGLSLLEEGDILSPARECCRMTQMMKEAVNHEKATI